MKFSKPGKPFIPPTLMLEGRSPLCPLENLNAQFESTAKLMKRSGRTGESGYADSSAASFSPARGKSCDI